jgi:hypothetical protein
METYAIRALKASQIFECMDELVVQFMEQHYYAAKP